MSALTFLVEPFQNEYPISHSYVGLKDTLTCLFHQLSMALLNKNIQAPMLDEGTGNYVGFNKQAKSLQ